MWSQTHKDSGTVTGQTLQQRTKNKTMRAHSSQKDRVRHTSQNINDVMKTNHPYKNKEIDNIVEEKLP